MVTKISDKAGTDAVPSTEWNWIVDLTDGTGVASANMKWIQTNTSGNALSVTRDLASANTDSSLVNFVQDNSGDDQSALKIQNDGNGYGLHIDNNGNGIGLYVDCEASTTAYLKGRYVINALQDISTGYAAYFHRNLDEAGTYPLVFIQEDHTDCIQDTLEIQNDGTGRGLFIDQNANSVALEIDSEATTEPGIVMNLNATSLYMKLGDADSVTGSYQFKRDIGLADTAGPVVAIIQDNSGDNQPALLSRNDGTGHGTYVYQNGVLADLKSGLYVISHDAQVTSSYGLVRFKQDNAASTQLVLDIVNDGTGNGLFINQDGDGIGLNIDSEATTKESAKILGKYGLYVEQDISSGYAAQFIRDIDEAGSNPLVFIKDDHASSTQNTLSIQNDGAGNGLFIDQNGNGTSLNIDSEATTASVVTINNVGTGHGLSITGISASSNQVLGRNPNLAGAGTNWFYRNLAAASTANPVVFIEQDNAGDDQNACTIQNDGTGRGLLIDNNDNGIALEIDSEATTVDGIYMALGSTRIVTLGDPTNVEGTYRFWRNMASGDTSGPVMKVDQTNAGDDQTTLFAKNDGTGPCQSFSQAQDVEVIDFDACTDGGTGHTTLAGSVKVQMPDGTTGYVNCYT